MADETGPPIGLEDTTQNQVIYYAADKRNELAKVIEPQLKPVSLDQFRERLQLPGEDEYHPVEIKHAELFKGKSQATKQNCHNLLNRIVEKLEETPSLRFCEQGDNAPNKGPNGTLCRPDIIAYKSRIPIDRGKQSTTMGKSDSQQSTMSISAEDLAWTQLESTAEYHSEGKTEEYSLVQAATYTAYHLQARPDRVVVFGFYLALEYLYLILTGPSGVCYIKLEWKNDSHLELLRDFIYRIIKPSSAMLDPTIIWKAEGLFDITLNKKYQGCHLTWLRHPIGRRTTIFKTGDPDVPIIKEQYLRSDPVEVQNLKKVHSDYPIPGIIRVHDYNGFGEGEQVVACTIGKERRKVRVALIDTGDSFMDIQTPYEVLVVIYDLLEATRTMYNKAEILHRDISRGNVLFRKNAFEPPEGENLPNNKTSQFCSALHLLDNSHPREQTPALLIDFEHSAVYGQQKARESAGTPVFVARAAAVLEAIHPGKVSAISGMPAAPPLYADIWSERLKRFPHGADDFTFKYTENEAAKDWVHELRHDAESIFWLLLWWAVHVKPAGGRSEPLRNAFWAALTGETGPGNNPRNSLLLTITGDNGWLHSGYKPLETLLQSMANHLTADLHWVTAQHPKEMKYPDYVHEAFQRHIFEFLVNNEDEPFMRQKRARKNRVVAKDGATAETASLKSFKAAVIHMPPDHLHAPPTVTDRGNVLKMIRCRVIRSRPQRDKGG